MGRFKGVGRGGSKHKKKAAFADEGTTGPLFNPVLQDVTSTSTTAENAQTNTTDVDQLAESMAGCSQAAQQQRTTSAPEGVSMCLSGTPTIVTQGSLVIESMVAYGTEICTGNLTPCIPSGEGIPALSTFSQMQ